MAVNPIAKSLEGILSFLKNGSLSYPGMAQNSPIADTLDEIEENLEADASSPGLVGLGQMALYAFDGINGAGACTCVGAAIGDIVVSVACYTDAAQGNANSSFESAITVADEIQQSSASDLSGNDYVVLLYRPLL